MTEWLLVGLGVVLTLGTGIFVATEFALVALDRASVQRAADEGDARAGSVLASLRNLSTQLSAAQVGITLTTLILGSLATPSVGALMEGPLRSLGVPEGSVEAVSGVVALVLASLFSMVVGELVPQFLGISAPLQVAKIVAAPVRVFSAAVRPLIVVLNGSANAILESLGVQPQEELSAARTPQELASIVRRSAEIGTLDEGVATRLTRSLGFGGRIAADIMTPRVNAVSVERGTTAAEVVALARNTGHSRFPVLGDDWDDVHGLVHVKAAVAVPHERRADVPVTALMVTPTLVPETMRLDPLLLLLRGAGHQLAIVVDEYGGTSGVVTLEDAIEELVGEVADEHDRNRITVRRTRDGQWLVPGLWRPDEIRERIGALVPDGAAYETLGGFLMTALGRIPVVGDAVEVPDWVLTVEAMNDRRVERVRFAPVSESVSVSESASGAVSGVMPGSRSASTEVTTPSGREPGAPRVGGATALTAASGTSSPPAVTSATGAAVPHGHRAVVRPAAPARVRPHQAEGERR